jgi:cytochrome c
MFKQHLAVLDKNNSGVEGVRAPRKRTKLDARGGAIIRLGEALVASTQNLIGAENQTAGHGSCNSRRLFARQQSGDGIGRLHGRLRFNAPFVDISGTNFNRQAGSLKQGAADCTF